MAGPLFVTGCGSGQTANRRLDVSPDNLPGGNRAYAGDTVNFSGFVSNSATLSPRFVVEKPVHEPTYKPGDPLIAASAPEGSNVLHGTIDEVTGLYTAPARLPDAANGVLTETISVVDSATYDGLKDKLVTLRKKMVLSLLARLNDTNDGGGALRNAPHESDRDKRTWLNQVKTQFPALFEAEKVRESTSSSPIPTTVIEDATTDGDAAAITSRDRDAIARLVADISKSADSVKKSVQYTIHHRLAADPAQVDVSIRTRQRLADYLRVYGDEKLTPGTEKTTGQVFGPMQADTTKSARVRWSIESPLEGAGGTVDQYGVYTAPQVLPVTGDLTPTPRRNQDIVIATSAADPAQTVRITVNSVTGDAPSTLLID